MPGFPSVLAGQRITASLLASLAPLAATSTGTSVTSSTVLINDPDLVLPVVAGAIYLFDSWLNYVAASGGGFKFQWAVPSGAGLLYSALHNEGGSTGLDNSCLVQSQNDAVYCQGAGSTVTAAHLAGVLAVGPAAGNLQLTWAQNTSSGTPTTLRSQSSVALRRVA
jgi:hypothetical protein